MKKITYTGGQLVNYIGKYLSKKIDGCYDVNVKGNQYQVFFILYYQSSRMGKYPGEAEYSDLNEMEFEVNVTTYSNDIRVNVIEISPEERTVAHLKYDPIKFTSAHELCNRIMSDINARIEKRYLGYEFIY